MIDPKDKRLIQLVGITYNQIENGVYAVILQEVNGSRRVPIIIGLSLIHISEPTRPY